MTIAVAKLALRNITRQGLRSALTLAAIASGVIALILSGGYVEDLFVQMREMTIHSQLGHLQIYKAGYYQYGRRDPFKYLIDDPNALKDTVKTLTGVKETLLRVNFSGLLNNGKSDYGVIVEGVEPDKEVRLGTFLTILEGRQLSDTDTTGILLGKGVAKALKVKVGDYLTLLSNTPEGALNSLEFEVVGTFQSFSKEFDDHAVRISLGAARDLMAGEGVHSVVLLLDQTNDTDSTAQALEAKLDLQQFEVKRWYDLADFYTKTVDLYRRQFLILQIIILIMVLLSVANSVNMAIHERRGEFGTLRALGNTEFELLRIVLLEYFFLGLVGAGIGTLAGVVIAFAISSVGISMPPPPNSELPYIGRIQLTVSLVGTAFFIGQVAGFMACVFPAFKAARLPITDALRCNI